MILKSALIFTILAFSSFQIGLANYNPAASIDYMTLNIVIFYPPEVIMAWACPECAQVPDYKPYAAEVFTAPTGEPLGYAMFYNPISQKFVVGFQGTNTYEQLQTQLANQGPVDYKLKKISGAQAINYPYTRYTEIMRDSMLKHIKKAVKSYPRYEFIFTGLSLGSALTSLAAFDVVTLGIVPSCQVSVYNYGSPRVGNQALAKAIEKAIPEFYRVVHWRDTVAHLPPCVKDKKGQCSPKANKDYAALGLWPVWHIGEEIFYNEANTKYTICKKSEDSACANRFKLLSETTWVDHVFYMTQSFVWESTEFLLSLDQQTQELFPGL